MKKTVSLICILWFAILCNSNIAAETIDGKGTKEGQVVLELVVTKEGNVRDAKVIKSMPKGVFDVVALESAKKLHFKPSIENGVPVEATINKSMRFKMSASEYAAIRASNDGVKSFRNGEYENALSAFNNAIRTTPENGQYYDLRGQVYYELKNYQKAVEDYNTALEKEPDMIDAYFDRGEAFRSLGRYGEAIEDYSKVIESDENYLQAYNSRAVVYNKLNDTRNMCLDLSKACELGDCRGMKSANKAEKCK